MSESVSIFALRHTVATLAYRTKRYLVDPPDGFAGFEAGHGVRVPRDILSHMSDVLAFACNALDSSVSLEKSETSRTWAEEVTRFDRVLRDLDRILDAAPALESDTAVRLLQGPLADALTHAGQLGMLRRMAGDPVAGENFFSADIRAGKI
jgi:hypothetical protein